MRGINSAVLGLVLLAGGSTAAHHSYSTYDRDKDMTIEGRLEHVVFANPHVILTIRTADGEMYTAEWSNLTQLNRAGVTKDVLKEGDSIVVLGIPTIDRSLHKLSLLKEIRRPRDGWIWKTLSQPQPAPATN